MSYPDLRVFIREHLDEHATEWDDLVVNAALPTPFLRTWWLDALPTRGGTVPSYLIIVENGRLLGGAALIRSRTLGVARYRFLGQGTLCPDHLDLLARPDRRADVARAFGAWFRARGSRILDLEGLPPDALVAVALGVRPRSIDAAPYQTLPPTYDEYLASLSSSFRRGLRRTERRLSESGVRHETVGEGGLAQTQRAFWDLHRLRGDRTRLLAEAAVLDRAVAAGIGHGEAQVDLLRTAEQVIAVSIGFRTAGRLSLYQLARTTDERYAGAGTVLLAHTLKRGIEAGCREADFLRGEEGYKSHFAHASRDLDAVRLGHGAGRALVAAETMGREMLRTLRRRSA